MIDLISSAHIFVTFQFLCNKPLLRKSLFIFSLKERRKLYESKTQACLDNFWFTLLHITHHRNLLSSFVYEVYRGTGGWRELKTLFQYGGKPDLRTEYRRTPGG